MRVTWLDAPQAHDYPAAVSYVSFLAGLARIRAFVAALKAAPVVRHKAKDILRAARLGLLLCAAYYTDEDTDIPVKIATL